MITQQLFPDELIIILKKTVLVHSKKDCNFTVTKIILFTFVKFVVM